MSSVTTWESMGIPEKQFGVLSHTTLNIQGPFQNPQPWVNARWGPLMAAFQLVIQRLTTTRFLREPVSHMPQFRCHIVLLWPIP